MSRFRVNQAAFTAALCPSLCQKSNAAVLSTIVAAAFASNAGLTRVSISLVRLDRSKQMDGRVIPDQVGDRRPAMTIGGIDGRLNER
jgi:hypothetical protein